VFLFPKVLNVGTALERAGFLITIPFPHSQPVIAILWDLWVWHVTVMASVAAGLVLADSSVIPVCQTSLGLKVVTDVRSVAVTRWEQLTPPLNPPPLLPLQVLHGSEQPDLAIHSMEGFQSLKALSV